MKVWHLCNSWWGQLSAITIGCESNLYSFVNLEFWGKLIIKVHTKYYSSFTELAAWLVDLMMVNFLPTDMMLSCFFVTQEEALQVLIILLCCLHVTSFCCLCFALLLIALWSYSGLCAMPHVAFHLVSLASFLYHHLSLRMSARRGRHT